MIKCPNCGSTTQVKLINTDHRKDYEWVDIYKCGCGCEIIQRVQVREQIAYFKGAKIDYEYRT